MKLLILIHSLSFGGAERVAANLANYWAEKGWSVVIVTVAGLDQDFYELHPAIRRIALGLDADSPNVFIAVKNNLKRLAALRAVLNREQPDIALSMMSTANCLLAIAALGTMIPSIGAERIYPPKLPIGRLWSWVRKKTYHLLVSVTALTWESARWLQRYTTAQKVLVIPNSVTYPLVKGNPIVNPNRFLTLTNNKLLLSVGRLEPQKGFDRLLDVFAELSLCFSDWYLVILGEGECREELEKKTIELGLVGRVFWLGVVGNVGDWYETADIYVMISRFEGFPNTLLEAMAYGLPVVSVDCETGPRDIIRHGVDGLLVSQDDQAALVDALRKFMEDDALRQRYSKRAVEVRERFSMERVVQKWESLFHELIS